MCRVRQTTLPKMPRTAWLLLLRVLQREGRASANRSAGIRRTADCGRAAVLARRAARGMGGWHVGRADRRCMGLVRLHWLTPARRLVREDAARRGWMVQNRRARRTVGLARQSARALRPGEAPQRVVDDDRSKRTAAF